MIHRPCWSKCRTAALESPRKSSSRSSIPSSPASRTDWEWACRSVAPSSNATAAGYRRRTIPTAARRSRSCCRSPASESRPSGTCGRALNSAVFAPDPAAAATPGDVSTSATRAQRPSLTMAQRSEARAHFLGEELRLLPGGEVSALGKRVVVDQFGIRPLRPTLRGWVELVRKDAHGDRDADAPDTEERLPPCSPNRDGRQTRRCSSTR